MARNDIYTVLYTGLVCAICSALLASAAVLLKDRQVAEAERDRLLNILKAFGVPTRDERGRVLSAEQVRRIFDENIVELILDAQTGEPLPAGAPVSPADLERKRFLPLYLWREGGVVTKYVFPVSGKGLWSTIYGYMALERDLATIAGITFYRHGETPGLGGEIASDEFQKRFVGKRIIANGQRVRLEVVKGFVRDRYPEGNDHAVDGISGATLTGKGLTQFLNEDLDRYERYFAKIRAGNGVRHGE